MRLLIIRHAIAEDREAWAALGANDDDRPLTAGGRSKMKRNAAGLHTLVSRVGLLATSPLLRARQTADIVARRYDITRVDVTDSLLPAHALPDFLTWLTGREETGVIAVVGHEPQLGVLATWLLTGVEQSRIELKKGAACLIEFGETPAAGGGRLRWSLAPGQLRRLAR